MTHVQARDASKRDQVPYTATASRIQAWNGYSLRHIHTHHVTFSFVANGMVGKHVIHTGSLSLAGRTDTQSWGGQGAPVVCQGRTWDTEEGWERKKRARNPGKAQGSATAGATEEC